MHLSPVVLLGVISITSARFAKVDRQEHHHNLGKRAAETSTAYNFDNIAPGSMKFDTPQSQIAAGAMKLATVTKQVNGTKDCPINKKKKGKKVVSSSLAPLPSSSPAAAPAPEAQAQQYAAKADSSSTTDKSATAIVPVVAAAKAEPQSSSGDSASNLIGGVAGAAESGISKAGAAAGSAIKSGLGLIGFSTAQCGASGASDAFPNGDQSFLNCGMSKSDRNSGWTPPHVTITQLKTVTLEHALATNDVWKPCAKYIPLFEKYAEEYGIPPILLAAFALQESTCNPDVGGDAVGLMQITNDKCEGQSNAECRKPDFNIRKGAWYFASQLKAYDGNVIQAIGQYNGWQAKMTMNTATAAANSSCCVCQNNLDYLFQMLNGWLIGKTGYHLGSFNNLAVCG